MSGVDPVVLSREGAVGVIELARPAKLNCLSLALYGASQAALDDFERRAQACAPS